MKRFITAAALTSVIATGAFAATEYQTSTINQYVPEVDVSTLSDEQVDALIAISGSADEADKEQKMRSYLGVQTSPATVDTTTTTMTTADASMDDPTISQYLPDVDQSTLTDQQKAALVGIATSADESDKEQKMRSYLMD
ncbi:hypothetical protein J4E08_17810 [Sagittula sp. NFXS13]|uniref:LTXXQ motif family protein n=1 Tax=Sagittula marina TaxID=943940 RepID=A0A7W6GSZ2_9RHOB|nr:hypothetical protein [Sagittula marina]MBB3986312.1 hypothetical protein [Sagittula marina]